jgi:hypothetical protein
MENTSSLTEPVTGITQQTDFATVLSALREEGVEPVGPCTEEGAAAWQPVIRFQGSMATLRTALVTVQKCGLDVTNIRLAYSIGSGFMMGPWWEMTFAGAGAGLESGQYPKSQLLKIYRLH